MPTTTSNYSLHLLIHEVGCLSIDALVCATRCDGCAAELKIDQIQSQCDLSINAIVHVAISVYIHRAFISLFLILYFSWGVFRHVWQPSKHETLNQCWFNARLSSAMLTGHLFKIGSTSHIARLL